MTTVWVTAMMREIAASPSLRPILNYMDPTELMSQSQV